MEPRRAVEQLTVLTSRTYFAVWRRWCAQRHHHGQLEEDARRPRGSSRVKLR